MVVRLVVLGLPGMGAAPRGVRPAGTVALARYPASAAAVAPYGSLGADPGVLGCLLAEPGLRLCLLFAGLLVVLPVALLVAVVSRMGEAGRLNAPAP